MFLEPVEKHHFSGEYQPLVCMYVFDVGFMYLVLASIILNEPISL
jgi:hypothetical protein